MFRRFGQVLTKKLQKWLISRESTKNGRFGQNLQIFEETAMLTGFGELSRIKLQKVGNFVKEHEKSSILPKLATFRANYHVSAFWSTFQEKVAKVLKGTKNHRFGQNLQRFEQTTRFRRSCQVLTKMLQNLLIS